MLRRYRDDGDLARGAATMAHVAALGFPAPAVHAAEGRDLVMERLHGPTLLDALASGASTCSDGARILADLHTRLHALPFRTADPDARVLHLDLHPANVVPSSRGPVLIDWTNATDGPADLDTALSAVVLAQVAVDPDHEHTAAAGAVLAAFLPAVGGQPLRLLDRAVARRAADPTLSDRERARLAAAAARVIADASRVT